MNTQLNPIANPFQFDALDVRTATDENGEVWFCAKDVCDVLDIDWNGLDTLKTMPENWVMVWKLHTIKGERDTIFINEAGVYRLIFRSNKPNAEQFADFICEEVLPAIRKTGFFGVVKPKDYLNIIKQIDYLTKQVVGCKNAFQLKTILHQLRTLHNMVGSKMPDLQLIKADIEQTDLFLDGAK
jgi:prophage antirepressor-like protein